MHVYVVNDINAVNDEKNGACKAHVSITWAKS